MRELKHTPLYENHLALNAKMVEFGGWSMPVQYTSIVEEHLATRKQVGLFDVSHMGEFLVEGPDAFVYLQNLLSNDLKKIAPGKAQYHLLLNDSGGVIDDLIVYWLRENKFWCVVNASNIEKDWAHFEKHKKNLNFELANLSPAVSQIAIQGPDAVALTHEFFLKLSAPLPSVAPFSVIEHFVPSLQCFLIVARTGYTGEDGFEVYLPNQYASIFWNHFLKLGEPHGIRAAGLGARDTLRVEAGLPLYGHELSDTIDPISAGLGWAVALQKETPFVGQKALQEKAGVRAEATASVLTGIYMIDNRIPRQGYPIVNPETGQEIGVVTSGTQSPLLNRGIALAFIQRQFSAPGTPVAIKIRDQLFKAETGNKRFYRLPK